MVRSILSLSLFSPTLTAPIQIGKKKTETVAHLREKLKARNLSTNGNKKVLLERLATNEHLPIAPMAVAPAPVASRVSSRPSILSKRALESREQDSLSLGSESERSQSESESDRDDSEPVQKKRKVTHSPVVIAPLPPASVPSSVIDEDPMDVDVRAVLALKRGREPETLNDFETLDEASQVSALARNIQTQVQKPAKRARLPRASGSQLETSLSSFDISLQLSANTSTSRQPIHRRQRVGATQ